MSDTDLEGRLRAEIGLQRVEIERLRAALSQVERLNEILRAKLDILRGHVPQMPQAIGEPSWGDGQSEQARKE